MTTRWIDLATAAEILDVSEEDAKRLIARHRILLNPPKQRIRNGGQVRRSGRRGVSEDQGTKGGIATIHNTLHIDEAVRLVIEGPLEVTGAVARGTLKVIVEHRFPEPLALVLTEPPPQYANIGYVQVGGTSVPTVIASLTAPQGGTSPTIEVDGFAADGTDLGPDANSPVTVSADATVAVVNDLGGGRFTVSAPAAAAVGATTSLSTSDSTGKTASLPVTVGAPPPPPVDHIGYVEP